MDGYVGRAGKVADGAFAGMFQAPAEVRDDLIDRALDEDVAALVVEVLRVCATGAPAEVVVALEALDRAPAEDGDLAPEVARVLTGLCRPDQDTGVLAAALPLYGVYGEGESVARALLDMTGHPAPAVRAAAVSGIEYFADEGSFPGATMELVERVARLLAEDHDAGVRLAAVEAFGLFFTWHGYERAWSSHLVEVLSRTLNVEPDQRVRGEAAETLAELVVEDGDWGLLGDALRPHVEDRNVKVAAYALARVATLGDERALERLWALLAAPGVHREYLSAATELAVSYRHSPAKIRRKLRKELKRLRKSGWAELPADEPNWSAKARAEYLDILIGRLSPW
ncbi:HEAT repeat domain-containing protein [Thermomonospora umbrina]|uniref:HEAT repeat protein n=1 Tax=Thermomonospora umbrina TaxID=111806 RepID=A0A3D9T279_9ACTN|nr:HEAT repeat domain-containing protein [Thermomonospora umbrina]REE97941.1 HEAT repeat protein [Thermomonospora umbrina]